MRTYFGKGGINYLIVHAALHRLAWGGSSVFIGVYLYGEGVSLAGVFLSFTGILALRFIFRSLLVPVVASIGMKRALIFGTFLQAAQYPALALVHGTGPALVGYCAASGLGAAFYFTCYHAYFAALGESGRMGLQVGLRQILMTAAAVLGPALGGLALAAFGSWVAFSAAAIVELAAIIPLLVLDEVDPRLATPLDKTSALKTGALLFATDGWISNTAVLGWNLIMFRALSNDFGTLGGVMAGAALAGAAFGAILGRVIDLGHARKALWFSASAYAVNLAAKAFCGEAAAIVVTVAILTSLLTGFYIPALMTAFYNVAKGSHSPLRYQILAEGAWDAGGIMATVIAAACCAAGASAQSALLLALAMVPVQTLLLRKMY
jgi:DHA1 family inner membrane transport protein